MNTKQQLVTGFLALVIVGSIAMMPVSAGDRRTHASPPASAAHVMASLNTQENPQEQVKDLSYN